MSTTTPLKYVLASEASSTDIKGPSSLADTLQKTAKTSQRSVGGQQSTSSKKMRMSESSSALTPVKGEACVDVRSIFKSSPLNTKGFAAYAASQLTDDPKILSPEKAALKITNTVTNVSLIIIICWYHCDMLHTIAFTGKTFGAAPIFQNRNVEDFVNVPSPTFFKKKADLMNDLKKHNVTLAPSIAQADGAWILTASNSDRMKTLKDAPRVREYLSNFIDFAEGRDDPANNGKIFKINVVNVESNTTEDSENA